MAIDYPNPPTNGQIYTVGAKSWIWDGTTWLTYGASLSPSVLKVDSVNARVGINNQSPAATLDVQATTGTAMRITNTGTGNCLLVEDATGDIAPFVINADGNVGMGVSNPLARLHISDGNANIRLNLSSVSADAFNIAPSVSGTNGYSLTLRPAVMTGYHTVTLPSATGTVALTSDPGLILIKTQTVGSGVSSVTVTGAFSSTYDNYKILYIGGTVSANTDIEMTLGGSTTGYYGFLTYGDSATSTPLGAGRNNTAALPWVGGGAAGQASHANVEVMGPFNAAYTKIRNASYQNSGVYGTMQGEHRVATSYTSFTFAVLTGTMTGGTIRVYGYRNS